MNISRAEPLSKYPPQRMQWLRPWIKDLHWAQCSAQAQFISTYWLLLTECKVCRNLTNWWPHSGGCTLWGIDCWSSGFVCSCSRMLSCWAAACPFHTSLEPKLSDKRFPGTGRPQLFLYIFFSECVELREKTLVIIARTFLMISNKMGSWLNGEVPFLKASCWTVFNSCPYVLFSSP